MFVLAVIAFGSKAGLVPLHVWLPRAHPAAPSHVSALMSGVMIKLGIYGLLRVTLDLLGGGPGWWGGLLLALGSVSALLGVLYALTERDLKRLLAYSSVENAGIITIGVGAGLLLHSYGLNAVATVALAGALFHSLNHACFKALLFLAAGNVLHQAHTRDMEKMGGLIRRMPQTALLFALGSAAIAALPPLNGFASEWMVFQGAAGRRADPAAGSGRRHPRGRRDARADERARGRLLRQGVRHQLSRDRRDRTAPPAPSRRRGRCAPAMWLLAAVCVLLGVGASAVVPVLYRIVGSVDGLALGGRTADVTGPVDSRAPGPRRGVARRCSRALLAARARRRSLVARGAMRRSAPRRHVGMRAYRARRHGWSTRPPRSPSRCSGLHGVLSPDRRT